MLSPPFFTTASVRTRRPTPGRGLHWKNLLFLATVHLLGLAGIAYAVFVRFSWWTTGLALLWLVLCVLSTTGGYHRLFAHRTYRTAPGIRLFYLLFGAASGQGPALQWVSDHRSHHAYTDQDGDPHNIGKGFWWAHFGWLLFRGPTSNLQNVMDLEGDFFMRLQRRWYLFLAVAVGFALPALLAWIWGDPIGGLLLAGFLRLAVQYEATFAINSVAHSIGRRPYATDTSARDSWLAAVVTLGEGYHNYHHRFPGDYRNGIRAHHFDPTKWFIYFLSRMGLAWGLKRASKDAVRKARMTARSGDSSLWPMGTWARGDTTRRCD